MRVRSDANSRPSYELTAHQLAQMRISDQPSTASSAYVRREARGGRSDGIGRKIVGMGDAAMTARCTVIPRYSEGSRSTHAPAPRDPSEYLGMTALAQVTTSIPPHARPPRT